MSDEQIDTLVFTITDRTWDSIDCTECGRCCMELKPMLSEKDQFRLAKRLEMNIEQLRKQFLEYDDTDIDEPGWRIKDHPCPFLWDKVCTIYEERPENCRQYPYLHKPNFTYRTWGMIEPTFTCPVVYCVIEELKEKLGFRV
ncbi:MAG: YkgJ family cysteine cluster protein [Sedimentisphaerales bacterium]|nr:YkgJ family cysteine cluster protein [Sedimentisphaerales bacterium]